MPAPLRITDHLFKSAGINIVTLDRKREEYTEESAVAILSNAFEPYRGKTIEILGHRAGEMADSLAAILMQSGVTNGVNPKFTIVPDTGVPMVIAGSSMIEFGELTPRRIAELGGMAPGIMLICAATLYKYKVPRDNRGFPAMPVMLTVTGIMATLAMNRKHIVT